MESFFERLKQSGSADWVVKNLDPLLKRIDFDQEMTWFPVIFLYLVRWHSCGDVAMSVVPCPLQQRPRLGYTVWTALLYSHLELGLGLFNIVFIIDNL